LREEHRLRMFRKRLRRRIFEPERDEVTGEWRRLHNVELYALCSLPNIIRKIKTKKNEMCGACGQYGRQERYMQGLGGGNLGIKDLWNI
jgi:hypothetical protein